MTIRRVEPRHLSRASFVDIGFGPTDRMVEDSAGESLASLTGGLNPEEIEEIRRAQALIPAYQLLRGLIGRNERDFLIRAAALEALMASGRASFSQHDLDEALYWLSTDGRDRMVRVLRDAGWLAYKSGLGDVAPMQGARHLRFCSFFDANSKAASSSQRS
jgi:hypothetical protein